MCHKNLIPIVVASLVILLDRNVRGLEAEGIIGGLDAPFGGYPYHVSILRQRTHLSICGGGIIGDRHVLTAGHCVASNDGTLYDLPLIVLSGTTNFDSYPSTRSEIPVEKVFLPILYKEQFSSNFVGDIAVLRLVRRFDYHNIYWKPLQLPSAELDFTDHNGIVAGFGWNSIVVINASKSNYSEEGASDGKLRYAPVRLLSEITCQQFFSQPLSPKRFCAHMIPKQSTDSRGLCTGDSGGPLVLYRRIVVGVASTSPPGCDEKYRPGMYTRVSAFIEFIRKSKRDEPDPNIISLILPVSD